MKKIKNKMLLLLRPLETDINAINLATGRDKF